MHHHRTTWNFVSAPLGDGYSGPQTYAESSETLRTSDGRVTVGCWRYDGRLESANTMQNHQVWVVTRGKARIEIDGQAMDLVVGSAVCFEAPYGPKIVEAGEGF